MSSTINYVPITDSVVDFNMGAPHYPNEVLPPFKYTDLDFLMQEIEVLLGTSPYDVFNAHEEFLDLKEYVFKTKVSNQALENKLKRLINDTVCIPDNYNVDVSVYFMKGKLSDIGIIDVFVRHFQNADEHQRRVYTFA